MVILMTALEKVFVNCVISKSANHLSISQISSSGLDSHSASQSTSFKYGSASVPQDKQAHYFLL